MSDSTPEKPQYDVHQERYRRRQPPVDVGSRRQVLFDDFFLHMAAPAHWDQLAYGVRFSLGQVEKHGTPILEADAPWESGTAWLCVLKEDGRYRMWYNSSHADRRGLRVSYAESDDGIHFEKPILHRVAVAGSTENNVVFEGGFNGVSPELGTVFIDPVAPDAERYKMVYAEWDGPYVFELYDGSQGTLRGAYSPDGIRWTRYYENFLGRYPDSQNCACWDPTLEQYVVYHRTSNQFADVEAGSLRVKPQHRGRAVGRIESDSFRQWSPSVLVLAADSEDSLNTDVYNSAYSRHPDNVNAHYLFPSFYQHYEGTFHVQVAASRDNRHWGRLCRETFIPLGEPGAFDCFIISVAPGFVPVDHDTWALYYRSGDGPHGGSHPITLDYKPQSRVSRVTFKRDRIIGIEGDQRGGHCSTRPLCFDGERLMINAEPTGPEPEIRIQLLSSETDTPIDGYTFDTCQPITTDGLDSPVIWKNSDRIGTEVPRESVRLHVKIRSMRMYAFQFLGGR
ncbi:MAG: hypothetical protein HY710_11310 [Candidatus Latescibacteria bacterium]|nr:hypothetical protein [Candidatus Latescibacterota bacterium]